VSYPKFFTRGALKPSTKTAFAAAHRGLKASIVARELTLLLRPRQKGVRELSKIIRGFLGRAASSKKIGTIKKKPKCQLSSSR
jgi:hypothetical protein